MLLKKTFKSIYQDLNFFSI